MRTLCVPLWRRRLLAGGKQLPGWSSLDPTRSMTGGQCHEVGASRFEASRSVARGLVPRGSATRWVIPRLLSRCFQHIQLHAGVCCVALVIYRSLMWIQFTSCLHSGFRRSLHTRKRNTHFRSLEIRKVGVEAASGFFRLVHRFSFRAAGFVPLLLASIAALACRRLSLLFVIEAQGALSRFFKSDRPCSCTGLHQ